MDEFVYNSFSTYFNALEKIGYVSHCQGQKLLVLSFYKDFLKHYKGVITKDDYHLIEAALDCLYGSSCLIPYPDYLKEGKTVINQA